MEGQCDIASSVRMARIQTETRKQTPNAGVGKDGENLKHWLWLIITHNGRYQGLLS